MLKWAVTKRSLIAEADEMNQKLSSKFSARSVDCLIDSDYSYFSPERNSVFSSTTRRSLRMITSTARKTRLMDMDKENNNVVKSPRVSEVLDSSNILRDISNLTPVSTPTSQNINSQGRKRTIHQMEAPQFAPTLPSFDMEYSPFGMYHKPLLDTYFNNPRYLKNVVEKVVKDDIEKPKAKKFKSCKTPSEPCATPLTNRLDDFKLSRNKSVSRQKSTSKKRSFRRILNNSIPSDDMGDKTLDLMIDAILESSKKDPSSKATRKFSCNFKLDRPNLRKIREPTVEESPTYLAAEDPANDLEDDLLSYPFSCSIANKSTLVLENRIFNEREVKTPDSVHRSSNKPDKSRSSINSCHLSRQRAVRRKNSKVGNNNLVASKISPGNMMEIKEIKKEPELPNRCLDFTIDC